MNTYHRRFLNSFSSENVMGLFCRYKNAHKEITESWGLLEAAKKYAPAIDKYIIIVVGDGCSPRTGGLFAYFTKAEVISIDPQINLDHWNDHVQKQTMMGFPPQRITVVKDYLENIEIDCKEKPCLVIWPHSHADMCRDKIRNYSSRIDIAMPCCVPIPKMFAEKPHLMYTDYNILSPKRTIHIWK